MMPNPRDTLTLARDTSALLDRTAIRIDTASREPLRLPEGFLDPYRNDPAFDYTEGQTRSNFVTGLFQWLRDRFQRFLEWVFGDSAAGEAIGWLFEVLPYVLVAVALYALVRLFLRWEGGAVFGLGRNPNRVDIHEDERIMESEDIAGLVAEALARQDFRAAVRYRFLQGLKGLRDGGRIDWRPQKTNAEYIAELTPGEPADRFRQAARVYETIWYGGFPADAGHYARLDELLRGLDMQRTA